MIAAPGSDSDAPALKATATTIPIVFGVAEGLVASLPRPDGDATDVNFSSHKIGSERLTLTMPP
jgi:hypothetical protein